MECDVLVVGGGPAGTAVARGLAAAGHDAAVLEEHPSVGLPVQCAGLFTPRVFELAGIDAAPLLGNAVSGARIYSPGGHLLTLDAGRPMAVATDRAGFDQAMAVAAADAGAQVVTDTRCVAARRDGDGITATLQRGTERYEARARLIVGADGVQQRVGRWFGLQQPRQVIALYGAQVSGLELDDPSKVVMWVGRDVAPGFFAYIVPTGGDTGKVEVGVWNSIEPAVGYYRRLHDNPLARPYLGTPRTTFGISACIPLGPAKRSVADRVMLVGDAAGQAKPTSGGGVYTALAAARHLVRVADQALTADRLDAAALQPYHDAWSREIGNELRTGMHLRNAFLGLRDMDLDHAWRLLAKPENVDRLNRLGDIDYPSRAAAELLMREPGLLRLVPRALLGALLPAA